ncbi:hypothetical protein RKD19_002868 [Streptomyces canus]|uniref:hypothetical protein n=1 Tax=unclassified Streptomyces TaxID=2593676 RepID=UPI00268B9B16
MSARRRAWRWALLVWAALVVVAGGLTLWLQDSSEPPGPYGWEENTATPPVPEEWPSTCPTPTPASGPDAGPTVLACAFISSG